MVPLGNRTELEWHSLLMLDVFQLIDSRPLLNENIHLKINFCSFTSNEVASKGT